MPWDGAGNFTRVHNWASDKANNIKITASRCDAEDDGFATGLENCLNRNGENAATDDIAMGGNKFTGVGNAVARDQFLTMAQFQDQGGVYYTTTGSSNAYVLTPSPAITAYTAGQRFSFKTNFANTDSATLNVSGLGAVTIKKNGGADNLVSGDFSSGGIYSVIYDGTNFQLETGTNSSSPRQETSADQTFALSDANTYQVLTGSTNYTWTVPTNGSVAFSTDTEIEVFNRSSADLMLAAASGVTINGTDGGSITLVSYKGGKLRKVATNTWDYSGDNSTDWLPLSYDLETSSNQYLEITNANWGSYDRSQFAISVWYKRESTGALHIISSRRDTSGGTDIEWQLSFNSSNKIDFFTYGSASTVEGQLVTTATYTDTASWHHILAVYDEANATTTNRMRLWHDGTEVTAFDTDTVPSNPVMTTTENVRVGHTSGSFDGLLWQHAFVSGSVPDISDFYNSGAIGNVLGVTGLKSLVEINSSNVATDPVLGVSLNNGNAVVASEDTP